MRVAGDGSRAGPSADGLCCARGRRWGLRCIGVQWGRPGVQRGAWWVQQTMAPGTAGRRPAASRTPLSRETPPPQGPGRSELGSVSEALGAFASVSAPATTALPHPPLQTPPEVQGPSGAGQSPTSAPYPSTLCSLLAQRLPASPELTCLKVAEVQGEGRRDLDT